MIFVKVFFCLAVSRKCHLQLQSYLNLKIICYFLPFIFLQKWHFCRKGVFEPFCINDKLIILLKKYLQNKMFFINCFTQCNLL